MSEQGGGQGEKRPATTLTAVPRRPSAPSLPGGPPPGKLARDEVLMAQHVEVGLVFQAMLGDADAIAYFRSVGVPDSVARRVMTQPHLRRAVYDANGARLPAPEPAVAAAAAPAGRGSASSPARVATVLQLVRSA